MLAGTTLIRRHDLKDIAIYSANHIDMSADHFGLSATDMNLFSFGDITVAVGGYGVGFDPSKKLKVLGSMQVNGDLDVNGQLSYDTLSDERLKKDVKMLEGSDALRRMLSLSPVEYKYKLNPHNPMSGKRKKGKV